MSNLSLEREVQGRIMNTEIFVKISSTSNSTTLSKIKASLDQSFAMFKNFDQRFSRFRIGNELDRFNKNLAGEVSAELAEIIKKSKQLYKYSDGYFDPTILPILIGEGYKYSRNYTSGKIIPPGKSKLTRDKINSSRDATILDIVISNQQRIIKKPDTLQLDLGGIGKGYIVDKVSNYLRKEFQNFVVDAGGDIFYAGEDLEQQIPYWVCGVSSPYPNDQEKDLFFLKLSGEAVATSSTIKRSWKLRGVTRSHLIDPKHHESTQSDVICVTAIRPSAIEADALAKVILLKGWSKGIEYASTHKIPAIIFSKQGEMYVNKNMEPYLL